MRKVILIVLTALMIQACSSSKKDMDIKYIYISKEIMPGVPGEFLIDYNKPAPPKSGKSKDILGHTISYSSYCRKLEQQNYSWKSWYKENKASIDNYNKGK